VQDPNVAMHPFPVVTHPGKNFLQSASVVKFGASVHSLTVQLFVPVFNLHGPSIPVISRHVVSVPVNDEQAGNGEVTHPAPVVTHPEENV
jgi:hypothetical protein